MSIEAILNPADAVRGLYQQAGCPDTDGSDWGVAQYFEGLMTNPELASKVPYLTSKNADRLHNHSLVRFRGMVQDMLDPEFYAGALRTAGGWRTSKYCDAFDKFEAPPPADAETRVWERKPLYCVPVPSLSAWAAPPAADAADALLLPSAGDAAARAKRSRDDGDASMEVEESPVASAAASAAAVDLVAAKQLRTQAAAGAPYSSHGPGCGCCAAPSAGGLPTSSSSIDDCMVYVYDKAADSAVRLHTVVDVVGIVSKVPQLAGMHFGAGGGGGGGGGPDSQDDDEARFFGEQMIAAHPPTSRVLRLHAILVRPLTPAAVAAAALPPAAAALGGRAEVAALRGRAVDFLSLPLGGDRLAAEFVLLQLLAQVTGRGDDGLAVGITPLQLSRCPKPVVLNTKTGAAPAASAAAPAVAPAPEPSTPAAGSGAFEPSSLGAALHAAVAALVPLSACLPVTVAALSGAAWLPRRDHNTGRTARGLLQLPDGCVLLLDETPLADGRLGQEAVANLQGLAHLVRDQQLTYDFQFYSHKVPVSLPPISLTPGSTPSLLAQQGAAIVPLPLQPVAPHRDAAEVSAAAAAASPAELQALRAYVAAARAAEYVISDDLSSFLQSQFVDIRKDNPTFGPEHFSRALALARLCSLSFGETSLSREGWAYMKELENKREGRVRAA